MEALSFSFALFKNINALWKTKKKALVIHLKYLGCIERKRQITSIVDVDDKNCLAELTVALKLNQGTNPKTGGNRFRVAFLLLFFP